jgi:hypothetical protein
MPVEERLRFTGENPPPGLWVRFPNWQNAYEEEGLPGQDETTLRPSDNQETIDDDVTFTAADAVFADGRTVPALLGVLAGDVGWIYIYPQPAEDDCWLLYLDLVSDRWTAMNGDALLPVPTEDANLFPMRVASRLPLQHTGQLIAIQIGTPAVTE